MSEIIQKHKKNGIFTVKYTVKSRKVKERTFYNDGCKCRNPFTTSNVDEIPNLMIFISRTSLIDRLKANKCELCGAENKTLEMHHINKLKNISGKNKWEELMMAPKRKTIAVCKECHKTIHHNEK